MGYLSWKLGLLGDWQRLLWGATDCSFLFGARDLLPALAQLGLAAGQQRALAALTDAAQHCVPMLRRADQAGIAPPVSTLRLEKSSQSWVAFFHATLRGLLDGDVIGPMCLERESNLHSPAPAPAAC